MAIQITPQKIETANKSLWITILFYFSLVLFFASVASYFVFDYFIADYSKKAIILKNDIVQAENKEQRLRKQEVTEIQAQIKDFSKLLNDHKFISTFFAEFEEWCHPRVWFSSISLNIDNSSVDLNGETDSFQILGQQMLVLKNHNLIKEIDLSNIQMGQNERINFNLGIVFYPQTFDFKKNKVEEINL